MYIINRGYFGDAPAPFNVEEYVNGVWQIYLVDVGLQAYLRLKDRVEKDPTLRFVDSKGEEIK